MRIVTKWIMSALALSTAGVLAAASYAGPIDDLQPGQWYEFPNSHLETVFPSPLPEGNPMGIMGGGYSGGAWDTKRHRLIVWGGGHASYAGNELYVFDVPSGNWTRLTNPTSPSSSQPWSVHSYDQLEYLPNQDMLFAAGGSIWGTGAATPTTWLFDFTSNSWVHGGNMPGGPYEFYEYNMTTDYDAANDEVIMAGYGESGSYNGASRSWSLHGNSFRRDLGHTGAFDSNRRKFVSIGRGTAYIFDVDAQGRFGSRQSLNASGETGIQGCNAPGLDFDPVSDRLVGWCSGSSVYSLNLDNRVWTKHNATNGVSPGDPAAAISKYNGTFGRWRYMPEYNTFILATNTNRNVFAYKMTSGGGTAPPPPPPPPPSAQGDCSPETSLAGRSDIVFCEPWQDTNWWQAGYLKNASTSNPSTAQSTHVANTQLINSDCISGSCLRVTMRQYQSGALAIHWPIPGDQQQVYLRYYLRLAPNFNPAFCNTSGQVTTSGGKFPGLADVDVSPEAQCGNGGNFSDGMNCWSMRAKYRNCSGNSGQQICADPQATTRFGSYIYAPEADGFNNFGAWDNQTHGTPANGCSSSNGLACGTGSGGQFVNDRWYLIEMFVKMNTPGVADGEIKGWVDGTLSYNKPNMKWRLVGHDNLHVRTAWLNVHSGGEFGGLCQTSHVDLDQMVIATQAPVGPLAGNTPAPLPPSNLTVQ